MVVSLFAGVLASCNSDTTAPGGSTPGASAGAGSGSSNSAVSLNTAIIVGTTEEYHYYNPSGSATAAAYMQGLLYDRLWEVSDVTKQHGSRILESWEWVDNVTLKVVLKDGIYFPNGTQMKASDILFSLWKYNRDGNPSKSYTDLTDYDASYVGENDLTAYIVFHEPYGAAENTLAIPILSEEWCADYPDGHDIWWTGPMGSGPYEITEAKTDDYVVYTLRDDYWDETFETEITQITIKHYKDSTAMWVDFQNGVIDVALGLSSTQVEELQRNPGDMTLAIQSMNAVSNLALNEMNEYLSDIRVREAITYAIDFEAVAAVAYGVLSTPASSSRFTSAFPFYVEREGYPYDPERSRQILADAGYAEGEISLDFVALTDGVQPVVAEAVQGFLSAVGINVNVMTYDFGTAIPMLIEGESDLGYFTITGGNTMLEPDQVFSTFTGAFKVAYIDDPTLQDYIKQGLATVDTETRNELYKAADQWLTDNFFALPIAELTEALAFNSRITSLDIASQRNGGFWRATLAK